MIKKNIMATALILTMCASAAFLSSCTANKGDMDNNANGSSATEDATGAEVTNTPGEIMDEVESDLTGNSDGGDRNGQMMPGTRMGDGTYSRNNRRIVESRGK